ncbi:MAG: MFS transporter, partial [Promicromonosporaceae bacterium]|nr:MFS transporter [Promicromonosporaceae bacterium]
MEPARIKSAAWSVFVAYLGAGFVIGTIAARVPAFRDGLGLSSAQTGVLLLFWALGSVCALPVSGAVTNRLGAAHALGIFAGVAFVGHFGLAASVMAGLPVAAYLAFWVAGVGEGVWAAAVALEGAHVERALGHASMSRFQAGESLGTVTGSAIGAAVTATSLPLLAHLGLASALAVLIALKASRRFLPLATAQPAATLLTEPHEPLAITGAIPTLGTIHKEPRGVKFRNALRGWLEPRTLLIGLVMLGASLAEGAASDWTGVGLVDGFGTSESTGALGVTIFFGAMLIMRLLGGQLVDRVGRVAALRLCAAAVLAGVSLFALAPSHPMALVGSLVWGLGAALGFPLGVSAASDDPYRAAMRVSVVSTISYSAFIIGPAVIGWIAETVGYRDALLVLAVPVLIGMLFAGALRPLDEATTVAGGPLPPRPIPHHVRAALSAVHRSHHGSVLAPGSPRARVGAALPRDDQAQVREAQQPRVPRGKFAGAVQDDVLELPGLLHELAQVDPVLGLPAQRRRRLLEGRQVIQARPLEQQRPQLLEHVLAALAAQVPVGPARQPPARQQIPEILQAVRAQVE